MTSTLDLIKSSQVLPERNFKLQSLDDISSFADGGHTTISNFQYVKHALNLTLKVDLSQTGLDYTNANNINYLIIQNSGTNSTKVGYFVINKKWVSQETIQFELHMDTINTFGDSIELSDKTKILRQHKDRYKQVGERKSGARFEDVSAMPYLMTNFDDSDLGITDHFTFKQATNVEQVLIVDCATFYEHGLPYFDEQENKYSLWISCGDAEPLTCNFKVYFLNSQYRVIEQVDELNNNDEFSANVDQTTYYGNQGNVNFNGAKYIAIRCIMTFNEPEEETWITDVDYGLNFLYGAWQGITQEEIDEVYDYFDTFKSNLFSKGTYTTEAIDTLKLYPVVDRYSEMINPMLYGGVNLLFLEDSKWLDQSWYLVYENQNNPSESLQNPVDCYLFAGKGAKVGSLPAFTGTMTINEILTHIAKINGYSSFEEMYVNTINITQLTFLYLPAYWNETARIQYSGAEMTAQSLDATFGTSGMVSFVVVDQPTSDYPLAMTYYASDGTTKTLRPAKDGTITFTSMKTATIGVLTDDSAVAENYAHYDLFGTSGTSQDLYAITSVDRTDPKLIKIIKLPYCPANITLGTGGLVNYDSDQWEYNNTKHALKLKNFNTTFSRIMEFDNNPFVPLLNYIDWEEMPVNDLRDSQYETKLYHSDYYQPKFVYDSFAFTFQLELITQTPVEKFRVQFNATNTINSRFMFTFLDYKCDGNEIVDYNNILYVARNNEIALFNQQYVNYIRNGYNYDLKSIEITRNHNFQNLLTSATTSFIGSSMNMLGSVAGAGGSKNVNAKVGGALYGYASSLVNIGASVFKNQLSIVQQLQQEELSLNAKRHQLANQSTGVVDANDVDLLDAYTQNKAKFKVYKVSPRMKKALFNLFFYTGYVCDEQGIPDTTSRSRFNFVSADIVLKKVPNLSEEIIDDMKARYNAGITFLHKYNNTYDFEQKYENWEWSVINAIGGN